MTFFISYCISLIKKREWKNNSSLIITIDSIVIILYLLNNNDISSTPVLFWLNQIKSAN